MIHIARWKIVLTIAVCVLGLAYASPNLLSAKVAESLPTWLPHKQINLGLDLKGGSHVLLEIQTDVVLKERLEGIRASLRSGLRLAKPRISYRGLTVRDSAIVVEIADPLNFRRAIEIAQGIPYRVTVKATSNRIQISLTHDARRELVSKTVTRAIEILRRRFDELGLKNATIQRQGVNRVIVEIPGRADLASVFDSLPVARLTYHLMCRADTGDGTSGRTPQGCVWLPTKPVDKILSGKPE